MTEFSGSDTTSPSDPASRKMADPASLELGAQQQDGSALSGDVSGAAPQDVTMRLVSARGTEDGLVLRIDGKAEWSEILQEITVFLGSRRKFLEGGEVSIEWLERLPTKEQSHELEQYLQTDFGITICARRKRPVHTMITVEGGSGKRMKPGPSVLRDENAGRDTLNGASLNSPTTGGNLISSAPIGFQTGIHSATEDLSVDFARGAAPHSGVVEPLAPSAFAGRKVKTSSGRSFPRREGEGRREMKHGGDEDFEGAMQERLRLDRLGNRTRSELDPAAVLSIEKERVTDIAHSKYGSNVARLLGDEVEFDEDANAKIVFGTLRSGQRIETPFSLVVVGDVNPGADLVAGGDIIVLGSLRGTAHAAAYDDECQDRVIFALQMQPMQLRIGSVISRGSGDVGTQPEVARVESRRIVVDAYHARSPYGKKLR